MVIHKYQIVFWGYLFILIVIFIDRRLTICKRKKLWSFLVTSSGVLLLAASAFLNCYFGFHEGLTKMRYDPKIILETVLLKETVRTKVLYFWFTATMGNSLIIAGLAILVICKLSNKRCENSNA